MSIFDYFKSANLSSYSFSKHLASNTEFEIVHFSNISRKLNTHKKNYYKIIFDNMKEGSNIAMYVAPHYTGVKPEELEYTIRCSSGFVRRSDYPLYLSKLKYARGVTFLSTDLELILTNCRDIHMEIDEKEGKLCTKYIIHCADDEDDYDMYFVFYDEDLPKKVITAMLNPTWRINVTTK